MAEDGEHGHKEQPIIIKKIKKGGHRHHGGAWKVAYADFVTAMMAFFIVMWILAASTPATKEAIAEYFNNPGAFNIFSGEKIPVMKSDEIKLNLTGEKKKGEEKKKSGWQSFFGEPQDIDNLRSYNGKVAVVLVDSSEYDKMEKAKIDSARRAKAVEQVGKDIRAALQEEIAKRPDLKEILSSLKIEMTSEGLRIELIESKDALFFEVGSARLNRKAVDILKKIGVEIGKLPNEVDLEGHTDSRQYGKSAAYTNWELSNDRANAARRILQPYLWDGQISKVTGFADRKLRNPNNPFDVTNRRISILVRQIDVKSIMESGAATKTENLSENNSESE